ncbi:Uncharacterized protein FWK35_00039358, partial [Aphis craccivora]
MTRVRVCVRWDADHKTTLSRAGSRSRRVRRSDAVRHSSVSSVVNSWLREIRARLSAQMPFEFKRPLRGTVSYSPPKPQVTAVVRPLPVGVGVCVWGPVAGVDSVRCGLFRLGVAVALRTVYPCCGIVVGSGGVFSYTDSMSTSSGGPISMSRSSSSSSSGNISISTGLEAEESGCSVTSAVPVGVNSGASVSGTWMLVASSGFGVVVGGGVCCAGFSRRYCWEVACCSAFLLSRCCWSRAAFRRARAFGGALAASWLVVVGVGVAGAPLAGGVDVVDVRGRGTGAAINGWGGGSEQPHGRWHGGWLRCASWVCGLSWAPGPVGYRGCRVYVGRPAEDRRAIVPPAGVGCPQHRVPAQLRSGHPAYPCCRCRVDGCLRVCNLQQLLYSTYAY